MRNSQVDIATSPASPTNITTPSTATTTTIATVSPTSSFDQTQSTKSGTSSMDRTIIIVVASVGGVIIAVCAGLIYVLSRNRDRPRKDGLSAETQRDEGPPLVIPFSSSRERMLTPSGTTTNVRIDLLDETRSPAQVPSSMSSSSGRPNLSIIPDRVPPKSLRPPSYTKLKAKARALPPIPLESPQSDNRVDPSQVGRGNRHISKQSSTPSNFISFSSGDSARPTHRESGQTNSSTITYPNFLSISPTDTQSSPARADSVKTIKLVPNRNPDFDPGVASQVTVDIDAVSYSGSSRRSPRELRRFKFVGSPPVPPLPHSITRQ